MRFYFIVLHFNNNLFLYASIFRFYEYKTKPHMLYYKLTYNEQSAYLLKRLAVLNPKRRKKGKDETTSRRKCSYKYYIMIKSESNLEDGMKDIF